MHLKVVIYFISEVLLSGQLYPKKSSIILLNRSLVYSHWIDQNLYPVCDLVLYCLLFSPEKPDHGTGAIVKKAFF
jgi:hypothetical protein